MNNTMHADSILPIPKSPTRLKRASPSNPTYHKNTSSLNTLDDTNFDIDDRCISEYTVNTITTTSYQRPSYSLSGREITSPPIIQMTPYKYPSPIIITPNDGHEFTEDIVTQDQCSFVDQHSDSQSGWNHYTESQVTLIDFTDTNQDIENSGRISYSSFDHPGQVPLMEASHCVEPCDLNSGSHNVFEAAKTSTRNPLAIFVYAVLGFLCFIVFVIALGLIVRGATLSHGCTTKRVLDFATNPVAGLMVGALLAAFVRSTSTIVCVCIALVSSTDITLQQAIYVVMGANVGISVTCVKVAFGHVYDRRVFEMAMASATIHVFFYIWSVLLLFPLEVICHPIHKIAVYLSHAINDHDVAPFDEAFQNPITQFLHSFLDIYIVLDKNAIQESLLGQTECEQGPSSIIGGWWKNSEWSDVTIGIWTTILGLILLPLAIFCLERNMLNIFVSPAKKLVAKLMSCNGYTKLITSGLFTSVSNCATVITRAVTPIAGLGVITLEQAYPMIIGSSLGATSTTFLAAMAVGDRNGLTVAIAHFIFNAFGITLFYIIPLTRKPILSWARSLAFYCACWPPAAIVFLAIVFVVAPGTQLALTYMCTSSITVIKICGWTASSIVIISIVGTSYWYAALGGRIKWYAYLESKRPSGNTRIEEEDWLSYQQNSDESNSHTQDKSNSSLAQTYYV